MNDFMQSSQPQQPLFLLTPASAVPTPLIVNAPKQHPPIQREVSPPAQEFSNLNNDYHNNNNKLHNLLHQQQPMGAISNIPSKVIHFRNIVPDITQADLLNLCAPFGRVTHILLLKNAQALVQFAELQAAISFVQFYGSPSPKQKGIISQGNDDDEEEIDEEEEQLLDEAEDNKNENDAIQLSPHLLQHHNGHLHLQQQPPFLQHQHVLQQHQQMPKQYIGKSQANIRGINVYPSFSSHQELSKGALTLNGNNFLANSALLHFQDQQQQQLQQHEKKNRILLVTIYNVQYLVNVDILYPIFAIYGPIEKIVMFNKTAGLQGLIQYKSVDDAVSAKNQLQGQSLFGNACTLSIQFSNLQDLTVHQNSDRARDYTKPNLPTEANSFTSLFSQVPYGNWYPNSPLVQQQFRDSEKTVLLVSNFNEKLDCDKIFNLFSCYGYIVRIKIFRSKADHALVQMASNQQASTAIACLKGIDLFGKKLSVNFSRHTHINASDVSDHLTRDYTRTAANRFPINVSLTNSKANGNNKEQQQQPAAIVAGKKVRYMCHPTNTVHISNLEATVDEKDLSGSFSEFGEVEGIRIFEHNNKRMALIKFKSISCAAEALCTLHNVPIKGQQIKISFSTNKL